MAATIENITTEQGVNLAKTWTMVNSYGKTSTQYTAAMAIKTTPTAATDTLTLSTTANANGSKITLGGTAEAITIAVFIVSADMVGLTGKHYVYDVILTDTSSNIRRPYAGEINNMLSATLG